MKSSCCHFLNKYEIKQTPLFTGLTGVYGRMNKIKNRNSALGYDPLTSLRHERIRENPVECPSSTRRSWDRLRIYPNPDRIKDWTNLGLSQKLHYVLRTHCGAVALPAFLLIPPPPPPTVLHFLQDPAFLLEFSSPWLSVWPKTSSTESQTWHALLLQLEQIH